VQGDSDGVTPNQFIRFLKEHCKFVYLPLSRNATLLSNITHYLVDKPGMISIKRFENALALKDLDPPLLQEGATEA